MRTARKRLLTHLVHLGFLSLEADPPGPDQREVLVLVNTRLVAPLTQELRAHGWEAYEFHDRTESIGRKIRDAELKKIPFMLIVGEKEMEANAVGVRKQGEPSTLDDETTGGGDHRVVRVAVGLVAG